MHKYRNCWCRFLFAGLLAGILTGCIERDNAFPETAGTAVSPVFYPHVEQSGEGTRTTGKQTWKVGDKVGIAMVPDGIDPTADTKVKTYIIDEEIGVGLYLRPFQTSDIFYFPPAGSVNFIAFHPYNPKDEGTETVTFLGYDTQPVISTFETLDMIYVRTSAYNKNNTDVALSFRHLLSRLIIKVATSGTASIQADLSKLNLQVSGSSSVVMALKDGGLAFPSNPSALTVGMSKQSNAEYHAMVVPHTAADVSGKFTNRKITFTIDGKSVDYLLPASCVFVEGKTYTLYFRLTAESGKLVVFAVDDQD